MSRMRAFCGVRLSVVTLPGACDAPSPGTRPLPTREQWATAIPARVASLNASSCAGGTRPGANPAATMPRAPASIQALTAAPSAPA